MEVLVNHESGCYLSDKKRIDDANLEKWNQRAFTPTTTRKGGCVKVEPDEANEWFCIGAKLAKNGGELADGLTGLAFAGGTKWDIIAFVKGFRSVRPVEDPQPTHNPSCEV